ncbi:nuclear pore glycoprotein p62 [Anabrus simplex]|uniref:nuclear pore glycoprotein p62 n=1 Tax=Anabrus simplex TaxID=316456 RepID=UPI0035A3577A
MSFSFGDSAAKPTGGFSLTGTSTATTSAAPSILGAGDASTKLQLPSSTASSTQTPSTSTSAAVATTTAATSLGFSSLAPSTFSSLVPSTSATPTVQTTSTVVSSVPTGGSTSVNFCQLEEGINKWTLELEEQEKVFLNQATQVNAWDRLLIENGEKLVELSNSVERVKLEQQQLDHELEFILAQQRELEDLLTPLEKELANNSVSDPGREHTYQLAENLDTQLKQMSEDLKEIIELLNETNRTQDNTDPIVQIGRILNAHMNSLQWIDQNTTLIQTQLDQVVKLHDVYRRENERSFHLTYD